MAAFLGISVWVALVTIVPGLITIALLSGACLITNPTAAISCAADLKGLNEWVYAGMAMTIMVLTQAFGILLEKILYQHHWYGPREVRVTIPEGIDPCGTREFTLTPYDEYDGLYLLLAELREGEDTQGHLQRSIAQFFLTNNTLVSFGISIVFTASLVAWRWSSTDAYPLRGLIYVVAQVACLIVSYRVACVRFSVMGKALWAARRRRLEPRETKENEVRV